MDRNADITGVITVSGLRLNAVGNSNREYRLYSQMSWFKHIHYMMNKLISISAFQFPSL